MAINLGILIVVAGERDDEIIAAFNECCDHVPPSLKAQCDERTHLAELLLSVLRENDLDSLKLCQ